MKPVAAALSFSSSAATIGIRGTGVYAETDPEQTYLCTCYGSTELVALDDPASREVVTATHHNARYILATGATGHRIRQAPFVSHTDDELALIESLVDRAPPFELPGDAYATPRRNEY